LTIKQLAVLDPTGARGKIFSRDNKDAIRVGDIVQVRRKNGEQPFAGVLLNIRRRGVDTGFLLRNQLTRVGVEMWFKLFSPSIEAIDLVQRRAKRSKRAKIYYMRYCFLYKKFTFFVRISGISIVNTVCRKPTHDMGSVQNIVAQYVRRRAMLRGDGKKDGGKRPGHRR
jgi:large subunit ribosomal protein L19